MRKVTLYRWNGESVQTDEIQDGADELEACRIIYHRFIGDPNRRVESNPVRVAPGTYSVGGSGCKVVIG